MQRLPFLRVYSMPRRNPPTGLKIKGGPSPETVLMALSGFPGVDTTPAGSTSPYSPEMLAAFAAAMAAAKNDIISALVDLQVPGQQAAVLADLYFPYQLAAIAYFTERSTVDQKKFRAGVFDPVGVGKTPTGIGCALAAHGISVTQPDPSKRRPVFPVIVIRPASAEGSWLSDIATFTGGAAGVFTVKSPADAKKVSNLRGQTDSAGKPYLFVMMTYDAAADYMDEITTTKDGSAWTPRMVILDEAHLLKEATSVRTQAVEQLTKNAYRVLLLTATPALSSAFEVMPLLRLIDGKPYGENEFWNAQQDILAEQGDWGFKVRADLMDATKQATIANSVAQEMRKRAVRRARKDIVAAGTVAGHPAQQYMTVTPIVTPIDPNQQAVLGAGGSIFMRGSQDTRNFINDWDNFTRVMDNFISATPNKPLLQPHARQVADGWLQQPQNQAAIRNLERYARSGYTTINKNSYEAIGLSNAVGAYDYADKNPTLSGVFMCEHVSVAKDLAKRLSTRFGAANVELVTGAAGHRPYAQISNDWTVANIQKFGPRWLVATRTANAGLNLTGADYLILVERLTSPGLEEQAEGRINRTGRVKPVDIKHIIAADLQAIVQMSRIENRRRSLQWLMGEKPGDDYATRYSLANVRNQARAMKMKNAKSIGIFLAMDNPEQAARDYLIKGLT